jgi:hypothetical protein
VALTIAIAIVASAVKTGIVLAHVAHDLTFIAQQ